MNKRQLRICVFVREGDRDRERDRERGGINKPS